MKLKSFGNNFSNHPLIKTELIRSIASSSMEIKQDVYLIGGYVRDIILNRKSQDLDFVTIGSAEKIANTISKKLDIKEVIHFKNFGTAMLKFKGIELQFVGARKESYRASSRKPLVENGTLEDDQNRRDFTINALAISLNSHNFGALLDPFDGLKDLKNNTLKTPLNPEQTFVDDPLRMLRAIRFAAQLDFSIERETFKSICKNSNRIEIVSKERIVDELQKIIASKNPSLGFKLLDESGLLELIFPEFSMLKGVEVIKGKAHKDNFDHTLTVLDNLLNHSENNIWLRWSALLHDIAKPATKRFNEKTGWTFHGHEDKGARMVPKIFKRLKFFYN